MGVVKGFFHLNGKLLGKVTHETALQPSLLCIYYSLIAQSIYRIIQIQHYFRLHFKIKLKKKNKAFIAS